MSEASSDNVPATADSVPKSDKDRIVLSPCGRPSIGGLPGGFDDIYPHQLEGVVSRQQFGETMNLINNYLYYKNGGIFCGLCACCWAPLTCCISWLCTCNVASKDVQRFRMFLKHEVNATTYFDFGLEWKFVKNDEASWLEIRHLNNDGAFR